MNIQELVQIVNVLIRQVGMYGKYTAVLSKDINWLQAKGLDDLQGKKNKIKNPPPTHG